jgi:peptidoglycan/xylan/chitin deacetylase (PgdA/CDA1 family)
VKSVFAALGILAALFCANLPARAETACPAETSVVAVPTKGGPAYGGLQYARTAALRHKEVALTFDDGPNPETTPVILDILDRHCVKATFFMVGIYAQKHPELVREVAARGHTIGTHTWSHPNNLRHFTLESARRQIRQGFAAVEMALAAAPEEDRERLAPFFRFPGLNDSKPLIGWLGERNIATLSCEFGADDWKSISAAQVRARAIRNIDYVGRGILILHDTKPRTAEMLSSLIVALRAEGYSFVQLVPEEGAHELAAASRDPLIGAVRRVDIQDDEPETAVLKPSLEPATALQ